MSMSKLLIDDYPIQVLPKLAKEVGLNEAILLQQLHYWLNNKSAKIIDGKKWIYNTYKDWEKQFPFWSNATIRRTINSCEKQNMILSANYNKLGFDKTKWYTINYEEMERVSKRVAQNEQRSCSKRASGVTHNEQTNTIDYTETTSETTKVHQSSYKSTPEIEIEIELEPEEKTKSTSGKPSEVVVDKIPYKKIIDHLNEQAGKNFRNVEGNKKLIRARWNEGYREDDFYQVIDNMAALWKGKTFSSGEPGENYLRPRTLFQQSKFDEYLNAEVESGKKRPTQKENGNVLDLLKSGRESKEE